jgi:hypothetical protein
MFICGNLSLSLTRFTRGGETDDIVELDSPSPILGNSFAIDWISISVAPTVMRIMVSYSRATFDSCPLNVSCFRLMVNLNIGMPCEQVLRVRVHG